MAKATYRRMSSLGLQFQRDTVYGHHIMVLGSNWELTSLSSSRRKRKLTENDMNF